MTEIMIVGTGLIMTAVAVAVGGVALEAVLRMLRRAIQPAALGAVQPGAENRTLVFSFAEGPIRPEIWGAEETESITPAVVPNRQAATTDSTGNEQQYVRVRRSGVIKSSSARRANAPSKARRGRASLNQIPLGPTRKWIGSELYPHPVNVVRTKIR